jgi:hypothetical protein
MVTAPSARSDNTTALATEAIPQPPTRGTGVRLFLVAVLLAILFLTINWQIVTGHRVQIWDAWAFYTPAFSLVADHARAGRLLLWDPWLAGGTPDFADPQVGAASPIAILVGAIGGGTAASFRAYWLLIWFLGPLGIVLLARHLASPHWAAFVVALGYAYCGFYTAHAEHTTVLYSFSFLPLFIWRFDVALTSRRLRPAAEAGALWGLSALGGYPAIVILSGGMLFLWGLGRCFCASAGERAMTEERMGARFRFAFLALVIVFCVGVLVLAPTYVAFFREGLGYSERAGAMTRRAAIAASQNALNPGALATFASPYLTALKFPLRNPGLWPGSDISVADVYIGVLPLILALFALPQRPRSAWRWWLVGIVVFSLACAVGDRLPFRGWLYDYCPPTRYFTHPGMFRGYAIFSAVVLALLAAGDLESAIRKPESHVWKRLLIAAGVASIVAMYAYVHVISHVKDVGPQLQRANWHLATIWPCIVLVCLLALFLPWTRRWLPVAFAILAIADASLTLRLSRDFMSDRGLTRSLFDQVDARHEASLMMAGLQRELSLPPSLGGEHVNSSVPLRIPTLYNDSTMKNRFHVDFARHSVLLNMGLGNERIWFAKEAVVAPPSDPAYMALVRRSESLGSPVLVVHPRTEMFKISEPALLAGVDPVQLGAIGRLGAAERISAQAIRYSPNHLTLKISCPEDGWLLLTDRWAAGWRATVNGQPAEVFGGDFIFRAVRVRAGENDIQFDYRQTAYFLLLLISWATLAIILLMPLMTVLSRRGAAYLHLAAGRFRAEGGA